MEDPVVPLERNLYGHPSAGLLLERQLEKGLLKYGWEKVPNRECLFVNREKGLFLSVYVDDIKLAGKKQKRILMKDVDLGEPTSFLDHVYLGCTQRECRIRKDTIKDFRQGYTKNCQQQKPRWNLMPKRYLHGPMTWKVVQRNAWKDIANLRIKRLSNETKSQRHSWMIIKFKEEENGSVEELSIVCCAKLFWNVLYLARIGRPDILWSVIKLDRAVTQWTKACYKRLARLIAYIHHTCEYRQCWYVGNTAQHCRLGLFQYSYFCQETWSTLTSGGVLCIFGSQTFVPISWMCKKQTCASHSSTGRDV